MFHDVSGVDDDDDDDDDDEDDDYLDNDDCDVICFNPPDIWCSLCLAWASECLPTKCLEIYGQLPPFVYSKNILKCISYLSAKLLCLDPAVESPANWGSPSVKSLKPCLMIRLKHVLWFSICKLFFPNAMIFTQGLDLCFWSLWKNHEGFWNIMTPCVKSEKQTLLQSNQTGFS